MSTTTIRIPDTLRARLAAVVERSQTTAHSLILEAITEKTDALERRASFADEADARYEEIIATGKTIPWDDVRAYLEGRARGENVTRPRARKLGK